MNLVADESVDKPIVDQLRHDKHAVVYIAETEPGISDDDVIAATNRHAAVLLTADKDFGELVVRLKRVIKGVILIRLAGLSAMVKAKIVSVAIQNHEKELENAFTVIDQSTIRIRQKIE
jgi:predicted nuclease of predicted toxin-antitoxin system